MIQNPDIYYSAALKTYIIFGEPKSSMESYARQAASQIPQADLAAAAEAARSGETVSEEIADEDAADSFVVSDADIKLITDQCGCTEEEARAAVKENKGDIVEAIMALSA
eukprot:gnl/Ergobibamus_cyprinoides/566.p4 GENE.gnl/Ergobibamus_cyprinoides/566~~gnl/Ergobibamus_cyprinoides/566.p4  ORF type:complete len:110 (+),score=62.53 gnl/Ergobibamus_cyprinoides/566:183-512(+)